MTDYSLWEVILNGNKVLKRTVSEVEQECKPTSAVEKQDRRNEMKAIGTLLMALPNKDQLKFHSYKDAKLLMEAIEKRYGGNKESKKSVGDSSEVIAQEDMNLKLLRSLPSEWKTHVLIWRNKEEIKTISLDELYNNLKIYEPELTGSTNTNQNSQNVAFVSSNSNNSNNNSNKNEANNNLMVLCIHNQKSKVECYNCHKDGHFARECRLLRNQEKRGKKKNRRTVTVETPTKNALVAQDGIGGSSSSDSEVDSCSKSCVKAYATLKEQYDSLSSDYKKSQFNLVSYKAAYDEPISNLDMMEDKVDNLSPQCTSQVLSLFEVYTPPMPYPGEVDETIGISMEVETLDHMKLEDLGLNTCSHDLFPNSREFPSVDELEPQPLPNLPFLDVNLGDKRGTNPPINPYSLGSFKMKVVEPLTIHTLPSPHVAYFY
ncbi:ribonuclease H-like domain-containing protein [Tanacetum coccineum]